MAVGGMCVREMVGLCPGGDQVSSLGDPNIVGGCLDWPAKGGFDHEIN